MSDELSIDDYTPRTAPRIEGMKSMNGQQPGDPAKLARALLTIAQQEKPLLRFVAGADAIEAAEAKAGELLAQANTDRGVIGQAEVVQVLVGQHHDRLRFPWAMKNR